MSNTISSRLEIEYGELGKVMQWCRENCQDRWFISDMAVDYDSDAGTTQYDFRFYQENDAIMFELRWR